MKYKGYEYRIIDGWSCPLAYVKIPKEHPLYKVRYGDEKLDELEYCPHGYFTYSGDRFNNPEEWWIGWDYGHCDDCWELKETGFKHDGKVWTRDEIENECHKVIDALIKRETE